MEQEKEVTSALVSALVVDAERKKVGDAIKQKRGFFPKGGSSQFLKPWFYKNVPENTLKSLKTNFFLFKSPLFGFWNEGLPKGGERGCPTFRKNSPKILGFFGVISLVNLNQSSSKKMFTFAKLSLI